jgi:hypothetical protein
VLRGRAPCSSGSSSGRFLVKIERQQQQQQQQQQWRRRL